MIACASLLSGGLVGFLFGIPRKLQQERGWLWYEGNRAVCRIHLDAAFERGEPANKSTRQRILEDLRAAYRASDVARVIERKEPFQAWMAINGVSTDELA